MTNFKFSSKVTVTIEFMENDIETHVFDDTEDAAQYLMSFSNEDYIDDEIHRLQKEQLDQELEELFTDQFNNEENNPDIK